MAYVDFDSMDFGTKQNPQCGICACSQPFDAFQWSCCEDSSKSCDDVCYSCEENGTSETGVVLEDIICDECAKVWKWNGDNAYIRVN
jgi:hypothetical protein